MIILKPTAATNADDLSRYHDELGRRSSRRCLTADAFRAPGGRYAFMKLPGRGRSRRYYDIFAVEPVVMDASLMRGFRISVGRRRGVRGHGDICHYSFLMPPGAIGRRLWRQVVSRSRRLYYWILPAVYESWHYRNTARSVAGVMSPSI